jgi:hypothetical protein
MDYIEILSVYLRKCISQLWRCCDVCTLCSELGIVLPLTEFEISQLRPPGRSFLLARECWGGTCFRLPRRMRSRRGRTQRRRGRFRREYRLPWRAQRRRGRTQRSRSRFGAEHRLPWRAQRRRGRFRREYRLPWRMQGRRDAAPPPKQKKGPSVCSTPCK